MTLKPLDAYRYEIARSGSMRVPGRVYASAAMLQKIEGERVAKQVADVACLPGIVSYSLAMPDCHWGYGACVGAVAAFDCEQGILSPGMVGYDISCGVRLLRSDLEAKGILKRVGALLDGLHARVPSGVGKGGALRLDAATLKRVLAEGARWAVREGFGERRDLERCEDAGTLPGAEPDLVSERAIERGRAQVGTLGSGNHFLEIQEVDAIYDERAAAAFGLFLGQAVVLIHTGSRGCGYQICEDALRAMQGASRRYGIALPDRQLACAPFGSDEAKDYLAAMYAGANFARANRQVLTQRVRDVFHGVLGFSPRDAGLDIVYDVCHNIAKVETHEVDGRARRLCVHRKGATRAFPAGHAEIPAEYRDVGQPVLVPGSMGTHSYVLVGTPTAMRETFGTTCHGAGRLMSRSEAARRISGHALVRGLEARGILSRTDALRGFAEEAPFAYKDVSEVVAVCAGSGISGKVARMRPLGVLKG